MFRWVDFGTTSESVYRTPLMRVFLSHSARPGRNMVVSGPAVDLRSPETESRPTCLRRKQSSSLEAVMMYTRGETPRIKPHV